MERKYVEYTTNYGDEQIHVKFLDQSHLKISEGDRISIMCSAWEYTGTVLSAYHYEREGWFIEIEKDGNGYGYWKQYIDTGFITELNGVSVLS